MLRDGAQLDLHLIESVTESFCWMETQPWGERWDWHLFALLLNPCSPEITEMVLLGDGPASDPASGGEDGVCPCLAGSSQEGGTKTPSVSCSPISSPIPFPNVGCTLPPAPQDETQVSCKSGLETSGKIKRKRRGGGGLTFLLGMCTEEKNKRKKEMQLEMQLQLPIASEAALAPPLSPGHGGERGRGAARRGSDPPRGTAGGCDGTGRAACLPRGCRGFGSELCKAGRPRSPGCEVVEG